MNWVEDTASAALEEHMDTHEQLVCEMRTVCRIVRGLRDKPEAVEAILSYALEAILA